MRRLKIAILALVGLLLLGLLGYFLFNYLNPTAAGIRVETTPASSVFVDGELVGKTPLEETVTPGKSTIKLVPDSFERPLVPYETSVNLTSGVETVIRREFGETTRESSGEIISFEEINSDETELALVTIPDPAQIVIDGTRNELTPFKTSSIAPGEHTVIVSTEGYLDKTLRIRIQRGYRLTAVVELAMSEENEEEAVSPTPTPEEDVQEEMVRILSTGIGFLRVRAEPSTLGEEVGRVEPGDEFVLLEEDLDTGWYKIEYQEGEEGWISNQYAEVVEEGVDTENSTEEVGPTTTS